MKTNTLLTSDSAGMTQFQNMADLPFHVSKYLSKHGDGKWKLEFSLRNKYKMAIVVPAIMEYENLRRLLQSLSQNDAGNLDKCIIIFVINNLESSEQKVKDDNRKAVNLLRQIITKQQNHDKLVTDIINLGMNIGIVDAATEGNEFEKRSGGVGLARKTGMDLALTIFNYNNRSDKNILVCLDADCVVDKNYINEVYHSFQKNDYSGSYIKFRHKIYGDELVHQAMTCYEIYMRYYVLGLKIAESPYAFHTVGSTLACDAESYIKIGGMNKKKGGEDFYFMEKLAKVGKIGYIDTTTVYPAGRNSWRVPFGTGPRVERFRSGTHNEYLLYSLKSFYVLKRWLKILNGTEDQTSADYLFKAAEIDMGLHDFLIGNNFAEEWEKISLNSKSKQQIQKQKLLWFDGFRTLKLIHYLKLHRFPDENMFDVLDDVFDYLDIKHNFERARTVVPSHEIQLQYLEKLRLLA